MNRRSKIDALVFLATRLDLDPARNSADMLGAIRRLAIDLAINPVPELRTLEIPENATMKERKLWLLVGKIITSIENQSDR